MRKQSDIEPKAVPQVKSAFQRIETSLPHHDSDPILKRLNQFEAVSMHQYILRGGILELEFSLLPKRIWAEKNTSS